MSRFEKFFYGYVMVIIGLILAATLAGLINNNSYADKRTVKIIEKMDELGKKLDAMHPKQPQFNIMHGYYKDSKQGEQPFRVIQVDEKGYIILSRERAK
jgi:hypothetical protein